MKNFIVALAIVGTLGFSASGARAQMMMVGSSNSTANWAEIVEHTAREEQEGKELWEKFRTGSVQCEGLNDEQFGVLGEYFMGQMMGDSHSTMNAMMMQMHGEEGEEQIHIAMGKRLSGCDTSAVLPAGSGGWMPMLNMMTGRWSSPFGFNSTDTTMMNFGGFGLLGGSLMILWWIFVIVAIIALAKWLTNQVRGSASRASALDIVKERYAKGEIDKKEFDELERDIVS